MQYHHQEAIQEPLPRSTSRQDEKGCREDGVDPVVLRPVLEDLAKLTDELGPNHDKVAEVWGSLGLIRQHMQKNVPAAVKCHEEALKIYRLNTACATKVAVTLNDLANCYERVCEQDRALQLYQEALTLLEASNVPEDHRVFSSTMRAVARLKRI